MARTRKPGGEFITFSGSYFGRSAGTVGFAGKSRYRNALGVTQQAHSCRSLTRCAWARGRRISP